MFRTRQSLRLASFDYRAGWFFITICSARRSPIFGSAANGIISPSPLGMLVTQCWGDIPTLHRGCGVDEFALMPDHCHGILTLTSGRPHREHSHTMGSIVGAFKSRVSRLSASLGLLHGEVWQRGFHDRVVRSHTELMTIRRYINENALAMVVPPRIGHR